jgi:hypothetical protein
VNALTSPDADASCLPSGEKATALTEDEWPLSVCSAAPVAASHSLTVLFSDTDAFSVYIVIPVTGFYNRIVLSYNLEIKNRPSGEKVTAKIRHK